MADQLAEGLTDIQGTSTDNRVGRPLAQLAYEISREPKAFGVDEGDRIAHAAVTVIPDNPEDTPRETP